jgi:hypothetical protein
MSDFFWIATRPLSCRRNGRPRASKAAIVFGALVLAGGLPLSTASASTHRSATISVKSTGALLATLHSPLANPYNEFGTTVAVSGDTAVVGFPGSTYERAAAYIYSEKNRRWSLVATLHHPGGSFGGQVAVSKTTVAVAGGTGDTSDVFVFGKGRSGWSTTPIATLADPGVRNGFGSSVTIWGTTVVVGSAATDSSTGGAYVYQKTGGEWPTTPTATLTEPSQDVNGIDESAVSMWGTTIVVGTWSDEGTSAVYVYSEGSTGWPTTPTAVLADPSGPGDGFGGSVAISGSTVVVGAPFADSAEGISFIYAKGAGGWPTTPTTSLMNPSPSTHLFGASASISGDVILISPWGGGNSPGAAYMYSRGTATWPVSPTVAFSDPSTSVNDYFGDEVAVSGSTAIVGAPGIQKEDIAAAAYVFRV